MAINFLKITKFGYTPYMIFYTKWFFILNFFDDLEKKILGIWWYGPFLSQKFLYINWNNIFEVEIWQKSTIKKSMLVVLSYIYVVFILTIFNLYHVFYLCIYLHIIGCWSQVYLVCLLRFMVISCENSMKILFAHMELQCCLAHVKW
jgi:hypothetical protein